MVSWCLHSSEDMAAWELFESPAASLKVNLHPCASLTYLGKAVFVLTLLEGIAVEIRRLVGQLCNDGILHLICGTDSSLYQPARGTREAISAVSTTSLSLETWGRLEEDDLLGLRQHDHAQGAHRFRGDVHGGLSVQCWQHCVLNVSKRPTGQLESGTHFQTLVFRYSTFFLKKKKPQSDNASHTNNTGQSNCITITPPLQDAAVKQPKWTWQRNHLHQSCYSLEAGGWSRADLIVFGCSLQPLVTVQVLLGGDLTGQSCHVEQHTCLLIAQTGQSCKGQRTTRSGRLFVNVK